MTLLYGRVAVIVPTLYKETKKKLTVWIVRVLEVRKKKLDMLVIHFTFKPAHNFFFIFVLLCIDIFIFFFRSNTCLMKPEKKRSLWEAANNFFFSKSQSSVLVLLTT